MDGGDDIGVVDVVVVLQREALVWRGAAAVAGLWPEKGDNGGDSGSGPVERVVVVGSGGWPTAAVSWNPVTAL
ncbi:hypothetical protein Tco_0480179, partial [Tanacetum coccineum]